MKKKFITLLLTSLALTGVGISLTSHNVEALSWDKKYTAIVTQPKTVYWYSYYAKQN